MMAILLFTLLSDLLRTSMIFVVYVADGSLLLASGGDDNALTVHRLRVTETDKNTETKVV
jgi:hypothetical protein